MLGATLGGRSTAHSPDTLKEAELCFESRQALPRGLREAGANQTAIDALLVIGCAQSRLEFLVDVAHRDLLEVRLLYTRPVPSSSDEASRES